jgi:hypothetical protein
MVNGNQVVAAGFAAATASFVTSRFGVTGTLLGAAVTAMIITGGSAILKAYFESVSGNVRKVPGKLLTRANRRKERRYAEPETLPERPDLRDNLAGRMRAALDWFSHLPPLSRRSILLKGLIAAAVAFVIGMGAVWGVERVINNSLSCGLWANCPQGATPGIHLSERDGAGTSISFGRARTQKTQAAPGYEARDPGLRQNGVQQNRSYQQGNPDYQQPSPRDSGAQPGGVFVPDQPAEPEAPVRPETPSSASPAPDQQAEPGAEPGGVQAPKPGIKAQDASPAPAQ